MVKRNGKQNDGQLELPLFVSRQMPSSSGASIPVEEDEFWTSKQRQASSLHEVSYRACFKPQLPRYFIERFTEPGDLVYDPFGGRGTTAIEAALLGRRVALDDINPLSAMLCRPRLDVPEIELIEERLKEIDFSCELESEIDLAMFYHKDTLKQLLSLRRHLVTRRSSGLEDSVDRWIAMVATNRLTGHSKGFFSVYTLPPNQAVSAKRQILINEKLKQSPEFRDVPSIIMKKTRQLLGTLTKTELSNVRRAAKDAQLLTSPADSTPSVADESVALVVTSPPFLDIVQYKDDNWLRCWFNGIDSEEVAKGITMSRTVAEWSSVMLSVFKELHRVLKPGGHIAFEVGEVRKGKIRLEEYAEAAGSEAGLRCEKILINNQRFTKTSNIWGVSNNESGTNSNRIALFVK